MSINFRGQTNVKYLTQTQLLRFYKVSSLPVLKITTKSTATTRRYQYRELSFKQIKYKRSQNLTSKHQALKAFYKLQRLFLKL